MINIEKKKYTKKKHVTVSSRLKKQYIVYIQYKGKWLVQILEGCDKSNFGGNLEVDIWREVKIEGDEKIQWRVFTFWFGGWLII